MSEIRVPHKFHILLDESLRYYVFKGGRGSAKSHSIARYLITKSLQVKLKILCVRELQNSITESVYTLLKEVISQYNLDGYFNIYRNTIEAVGGSVFIFKGLAHNIESVKSTEGVDIVWIEEADKVSQNSWDILVPTIRKPNSRFIVNYNPTHDDDPVHVMFTKETMPDSTVVTVNWQDNPWFPEVLKKEMEHMRATNYDKYLHVWEGELRTISDAQVFKNKFVVEDFSSEGVESFYYGMDFGFSVDPVAITRLFIRGRSLYIDREQYGHQIEINHYPAMINKIFEGTGSTLWKLKADCARPETISYLRNLGYNITAAKKWTNSVEEGVEYLKSFDKIVIHPSCTHTAEEFRRYSYKIDKHTNEILPIIVDDYNHCIDSGRYSIDDLIKSNTTIYDDGVL